MASEKVKEYSHGPTEVPTEATLLTTRPKAKGSIDMETVDITKGPGKQTKCMVWALLSILMATATKASTVMAKGTVSVLLESLISHDILASGLMESGTVKVYSTIKVEDKKNT